MIIGVAGPGIANQLYDLFLAYIISKKYGHEMSMIVSYDYSRFDFYSVLRELVVPDFKVYSFNPHYLHRNTEALRNEIYNSLKLFHPQKNIKILAEEDFIIDDDIVLKDTSVLEGFDILVLNFHIYSRISILMNNRSLIMPLWELKSLNSELEHSISTIDDKTVAVHVRASAAIRFWGEENARDFFRAAIVLFRDKIPGAHFLIFSNEYGLASKWIGNAEDITYVLPHGNVSFFFLPK